MSQKFTFGTGGEVEIDNNYRLSEDELNEIELWKEDEYVEEDEAMDDIEATMEQDKLKKWLQAKSKGVSF